MGRWITILFHFFVLVVGVGCTMDARVESLSKAPTVINKTIEPGYNPEFVLSSQTVLESAGNVVVTLSLPNEALRDMKIDYTVTGSAATGLDHDLFSGSAFINVGEKSTQIVFTVLSDTLNEIDETVVITLAHNSSTHTVTIQDDDVSPSIIVSAGKGFEGGAIEFPVILSGPSGRDISFNYSISNGTTSGADFSSALTGVFTIPAGQTSATLSISALQDSTLDGLETFTLNLSNPVNASTVTPSVSGSLYELLVEDIYPNYGHSWGYYVQVGSDLPCYTFYSFGFNSSCKDGGMLKIVKVPAFSSCTGLSLTDSQGAFLWGCSVVNSKVEFKIIDFNIGKGLKNIVTEAGFNPIKVQLTQNPGPVIMESALVNGWWSNSVASLPNNTGGAVSVLSSPGTIYVEDTSKNIRGYNIDADHITVVTGPGVILTLENSTPNNCNGSTGKTTTPNFVVGFCTGDRGQAWIEANLQLSSATQYGVFIGNNSEFIRIHGGAIRGDSNDWAIDTDTNIYGTYISQMKISNTYAGIMSGGTENTTIEDTVIENLQNPWYPAIDLWASDYSRISRVRIHNTGNMGIDLDSANDSIIHDVVISNNTENAIYLEGEDVILVNAVLVNNTLDGISGDGILSGRNFFLNVTSVNNNRTGIEPVNDSTEAITDFSYTANSVAANNLTGLRVADSLITVELKFENIFLGNNGTALSLDNVSQVFFYGLLNLGGNTTNCNVLNSGSNPNVGITHSTCALVTPSTGTLSTSLNISSSFVGKAGTDSVNTTAGASTNTAIAYGSITDHSGFENWYRVWGKNGSAYPNADNRGRCSSGTCNIWDYRLAAGANSLRNVNGTFVDGANCPTSVQGDNFYSTNNGFKFLKYATEISRDGIGNENGICESDEACLFSPHVGAYQGDRNGNYLAHSCIFQDSATNGIKGVKMYALPE